MNKQKIKEFWKNHKKEILPAVYVGALCGVSCWIGYSAATKKIAYSHPVGSTFYDAVAKYGTKNTGIYAARNHPLKPSELGKLGENMIKAGVPKDQILTHFLAFGKVDK